MKQCSISLLHFFASRRGTDLGVIHLHAADDGLTAMWSLEPRWLSRRLLVDVFGKVRSLATKLRSNAALPGKGARIALDARSRFNGSILIYQSDWRAYGALARLLGAEKNQAAWRN